MCMNGHKKYMKLLVIDVFYIHEYTTLSSPISIITPLKGSLINRIHYLNTSNPLDGKFHYS